MELGGEGWVGRERYEEFEGKQWTFSSQKNSLLEALQHYPYSGKYEL